MSLPTQSPKAAAKPVSSKSPKLSKARAVTKPARTHPSYKDMVTEAMLKSDQRLGASLQSICAYILTTYPSANKPAFRFHVRSSIARGLGSGSFKRARKTADATGITGRFLVVKSKKGASKDKDKATKRARSASPGRPKKIAKETGGKAKATKPTVKAANPKGATKVAKPRSRSKSPKKGKAKLAKTASKSKSPKPTKKSTPKKAGEKAGAKKGTPKKKAAAAEKPKAAAKAKTTPKKPAPKKKSTPKPKAAKK